MATPVFGIPVTRQTLVGAGYDADKITQRDMAKYAEAHSTDEGKDKDALQFVENLKARYGNGVSALCLLYNATGAPLTFVRSHSYRGNVYYNPYPSQLQNGQWGAFLHVKPGGQSTGSSAAIVYRGVLNGNTKDWLLTFDIPWGPYRNKVYTEIRNRDHWPSVGSWDFVNKMRLQKSGQHSEDKQEGRWSVMQAGDGTSPIVRTTMKLL